eukprot:PhF_6_TR21075/c0_g1_i3/m.30370
MGCGCSTASDPASSDPNNTIVDPQIQHNGANTSGTHQRQQSLNTQPIRSNGPSPSDNNITMFHSNNHNTTTVRFHPAGPINSTQTRRSPTTSHSNSNHTFVSLGGDIHHHPDTTTTLHSSTNDDQMNSVGLLLEVALLALMAHAGNGNTSPTPMDSASSPSYNRTPRDPHAPPPVTLPPNLVKAADTQSCPNEFICPISKCLMDDPVVTSDGHTYQRGAIQEWFDSGHETSPLTNAILPNLTLIPNFALRNMIESWKG